MTNCKYCKADCIFRGEQQTKECKGYIPMTNADRIRAMSDEELANFMAEKPLCPKPKEECAFNCSKCWFEWLQQPAEEVKDA